MKATILQGHVFDRLRDLPDESVQCVVTSPPYWGLRDYGIPPSIWGGDADCPHEWLTEEVEREMRRGLGLKESKANTRGGAKKCAEVGKQRIERGSCLTCGAWVGCFGSEPTPEMYTEHATMIFREVRRVLRNDGTCWVNLGDSYANDGKWGGATGGKHVAALHGEAVGRAKRNIVLKPKDLVGIPWRFAFALQADGWWLRQDIVWSKPNPMPESVTDRCTKAHEYLFLLTKSARYYYDAEAIKEDCVRGDAGSSYRTGKTSEHQLGRASTKLRKTKVPGGWDTGAGAHGTIHRTGRTESEYVEVALSETRNKRSVWEVATQAYSEAHFATFPEKLVEPCILAGSKPGDTVLDPFSGSGTTGVVAMRYHRQFIGMELNPEYIALAERRISSDAPLLNEIVLDGVPA